jgi:hypothetical protein
MCPNRDKRATLGSCTNLALARIELAPLRDDYLYICALTEIKELKQRFAQTELMIKQSIKKINIA